MTDSGAQASAFLSPASFHPVLSVPLPPSFASAPPSSSSCHPYLLVFLPPALFLDPWQPPASTAEDPAAGAAPHAPFAAVHYLAAGHPSRVELERAVGWSRPAGKAQPGSTSSSEGAQGKDAGTETRTVKRFVAGQGLVSETETVPARDRRARTAIDRERETVLLRLPRWPDGASEFRSNQAEGQSKITRVPLHARYLPPVQSSAASTSKEGSGRSQWDTLLDTLKGTNGNYADVSIEGLEAFWACHGGATGASEDDFERWLSSSGSVASRAEEEEEVPVWERVARPSALLPEGHTHLTSPLLSSLRSAVPDSDSASGSPLTFYRHTPSSYSPRSAAAVSNPLTISLPRGDASYATWSMNVTQAVVWIMTIWFIGRIWSITGSAEREATAREADKSRT